MNTWSNLPNAAHIDWVLVSIEPHTQLWFNAGQIYSVKNEAWIQAWIHACNQTWSLARLQARDPAWDQARVRAREQARLQALDQARDPAWEAISGAILTLTAYDHTDRYLNMKPDQLNTWAHLSEDPAAILLLPMVWVQQQIKEQQHYEHMV